MNVLLIEDNNIDKLYITEIIKKIDNSINVDHVSKIRDARNKLESSKFDLILTDVYLQNENVTDNFLDELKHINTPIIVTSGQVRKDLTIKKINQYDNVFYIDKYDINSTILGTLITKQIQNLTSKEHLTKKSLFMQKRIEILDLFTKGMTHDLKNPLNLIMGLINCLLIDEEDEDKKEMLQIIKSSASDIDSTLNTLLDYMKLDYNSNTTKEIDVNQKLEKIVKEVQNHLHFFDFNVHLEGNAIFNVPEFAFDTIFRNLISNSVKYRDPSRKLEIEIAVKKDQNDNYHIIYHDNARGFTENHPGEIFEAFSRLDSSRDVKGHGIGMALVKKSIEVCHGIIDYKSNPGFGTTFHLTFKV